MIRQSSSLKARGSELKQWRSGDKSEKGGDKYYHSIALTQGNWCVCSLTLWPLLRLPLWPCFSFFSAGNRASS